MFLNKLGNQPASPELQQCGKAPFSQAPPPQELKSFFTTHPLARLLFISLGALVLLAGIIIFVLIRNPVKPPAEETATKTISQPGLVLLDVAESDNQWLAGNEGFKNIKAENLFFGDFYRRPQVAAEVSNPGVKLPLNVKEDTANYYNVARLIPNLESGVADLNQNGFAVIANPFANLPTGKANDFYSLYNHLQKNNLPFLVTNDFLLYYYQNSLKNIFQDLERDVFYNEFWQINKQFFQMADKRYRERYSKQGVVADPLLEAQRLEAAYFAVILELLQPQSGQVVASQSKTLIDPNKFSLSDSETYHFTLPDYLTVDVEAEVALIRAAKAGKNLVKSPTLLYRRDYSQFAVPANYQANAKLNNFYLARQWATSLFPLFYQNQENCADCLLSKEDWQLNFIAVNFIAEDFNDNQELKNRWAKIYKTLSYFLGLRGELTYIHYNDAFKKTFPDKTVAAVLTDVNPAWQSDLQKLQTVLAAYKFDSVNGAYDRTSQQSQIGLRLLQDNYWPESYIFYQLINGPVGLHNSAAADLSDQELVTGCSVGRRQIGRCLPFAQDLLNVVFNPGNLDWSYLQKNTDYQFYQERLQTVRQHVSQFDTADWHLTGFWSGLDVVKNLLEQRQVKNLAYTQTAAWTSYNLQSGAAALYNLQLPPDQWQPAYRQTNSLSLDDNIVKYNYLEPNLVLVSELLQNARMLYQTFYHLGLIKEHYGSFDQLLNNLQSVKLLMQKELQNQDFNFDDWRFVNDLISEYTIVTAAEKTLRQNFVNPDTGKSVRLTRDLTGLRLLLSVSQQHGRAVLVIGPIFNYQEKKF